MTLSWSPPPTAHVPVALAALGQAPVVVDKPLAAGRDGRRLQVADSRP